MISLSIAIAVSSLYRLIERDGRVKTAVDRGRARDFQTMMSMARDKALAGSFQHFAAYMRVIHKIEVSDLSSAQRGGNQIVVNINLGGDVTGDVIEGATISDDTRQPIALEKPHFYSEDT